MIDGADVLCAVQATGTVMQGEFDPEYVGKFTLKQIIKSGVLVKGAAHPQPQPKRVPPLALFHLFASGCKGKGTRCTSPGSSRLTIASIVLSPSSRG